MAGVVNLNTGNTFDPQSMIGKMVQSPFRREEYVTITGADSIKNEYSGTTKEGKPITFSRAAVPEVGYGAVPAPKARVTPSAAKAPAAPLIPANISRAPTTGVIEVAKTDPLAPVTKEIKAQTAVMKQQQADYNQGQLALAGANFMLDVMNANSAYNQVQGTAALNIMQSKNQAADAISRGRQAQMDAQSEGYNAGQDALLNAAAQGQDVQGAATQKIQKSYEAIGAYNGMREEINAMREAHGYELEQINYDYQTEAARLNKNAAIASSALNFGANAYAYGR